MAATLLTACEDNGDGTSLPGGRTDTTPPTVSSTSPANSATGVATNAAITVTFSENMTLTTLTTAFTIAGVTGTVTSRTTTTATFTPTSSLANNTLYTATITTGATDLRGNALASNYTWSFTTQPAPGTLDTSFNATGKVTTTIGEGNDVASAVAIQTDGKVVVAGHATIGTNLDVALVRYNTDGSLDTTFDTDGRVTTAIGTGDDYALAVAIQADGKIVVAGYATIGANLDVALVRYNTDGSLDITFNSTGKVTTAIGAGDDAASAVAIQADNKIVVTGFSFNGTNNDVALVRYNTNGRLDDTFGGDGKVTTAIGTGGVASAVAIQTDDRIVVAGHAVTGASFDVALIRYNTDGSLDPTFGTDGRVTTAISVVSDVASAVAIQTDGRIIVAGYAAAGTNLDVALIRYNTNGSLDTTFDIDGIVTTAIGEGEDAASAVAIQTDGKIVVAGRSFNGTNNDIALVRYNTNGSLDTTFDTDGKVTTAIGTAGDAALAVAIQQADGRIVTTGYSGNGTNDDFALVRYFP